MSRKLDDWVESFITYTHNTEPRKVYRRWVALSTIASALKRKVKLVWGSEIFFANMFIVLVGPPASRKGTAMRPGKEFITRAGIAISADETSKQRLVKAMQDTAAQIGQDSKGRPIVHCSLTIHATELTVFLGFDSRDMLSMLQKFYDSEERYIKETISRGTEEISNVWCNLLGATTPGQLQAAMPLEAISYGFASRTVFVFEEDKERVAIKPTLDEELGGKLMSDFEEILHMHGEFTTTPAYDALYTNWRMDAESKIIFREPHLEYYVQRRPTHLFKLSLLYSAARTSDKILTDVDLQKAINTLHEVEIKMPHVFSGVGLNPLAGVQQRVGKAIERQGVTDISELMREFSNDLDHEQMQSVLKTLEAMKMCRQDLVNRKIVAVKKEETH